MDEETDIEMYSESESEVILEVLNDVIEQLEEKVKYYKTKANERFNSMLKSHFENEQLKKTNENLKSLLISKFPGYMSAVIECL